jgi:hypothetical protein
VETFSPTLFHSRTWLTWCASLSRLRQAQSHECTLPAASIQNGQFISGNDGTFDQTRDPGSRAELIQGYSATHFDEKPLLGQRGAEVVVVLG